MKKGTVKLKLFFIYPGTGDIWESFRHNIRGLYFVNEANNYQYFVNENEYVYRFLFKYIKKARKRN